MNEAAVLGSVEGMEPFKLAGVKEGENGAIKFYNARK